MGDFPTSPAIAAAAAIGLMDRGCIPEALAGAEYPLGDKGILLLSLGEIITAVELLD